MIAALLHPVRRRGFSMLETLLALALLGALLLPALATVGASARHRRIDHDRQQGSVLARDLMSEILLQDYREPFEAENFGPEDSEGNDRAKYDDIDDYDGWSASPPVARDGTTLMGTNGWTRSVTVQFADPSDLATSNGSSDDGIKIVTVMAIRNGRTAATLSAIRTVSWRTAGQQ